MQACGTHPGSYLLSLRMYIGEGREKNENHTEQLPNTTFMPAIIQYPHQVTQDNATLDTPSSHESEGCQGVIETNRFHVLDWEDRVSVA